MLSSLDLPEKTISGFVQAVEIQRYFVEVIDNHGVFF